MEYPGSKFTRSWRLAMLTIFILAFFIISPLLVFYTAGYHYDFKNGIIRQTGAISIDILPKSATVYLNNNKIDIKIPIRLKNVNPGKYKIKISQEGFYDWEKEVTLESRQTIYIKEIKLIKKSQPQKITEGEISNLNLSPDNKYLVYQKNISNRQEFFLRDLNSQKETSLLSSNDKEKIKVDWSPRSNYLTLSNESLSKIQIFNTQKIEDNWYLNSIETNKISKWQWGNGYENEIYYSTKNQLIVINVANKQKTVISKNNLLDWYSDNRQIWTIQKTTSTNQLLIIKNTFGFAQNFLQLNNIDINNNQNNWRFVSAVNNELLLKKPNQSDMLLIYNDKQYNFYGEKFLSSKYNNWWIMWTPWEITTYSRGEEPFLLNRSGEQLQKVVVLDEYNTLGLIWADKMTALFPYYFVNHILINQKINDAEADSQNRMLLFSAEINEQKGLWQIQY